MKICSCESGIGNLGTPQCVPKFGIARRDIFVNLIDNAGALNFIDPSVDIDDAFLSGKINETDASKRWHISPVFKNGTSERAESEFEEFEDGSKEKIRSGTRALTGMYVKKDTAFLSKLDKNACVEVGVFKVSDNGSIMGRKGADGKLYPIPLAAFDTNWTPQTDTSVEKVMFSYEFKRLVEDADLRMIASSEFTADINNYTGLIDVNGVASNQVDQAFTATLRTCYGSVGNEIPYTGLLLGDITLYNVTADSAITAATVTEGEDGVYAITYTENASASDVIRMTISVDGFDFSQVATVNFGY